MASTSALEGALKASSSSSKLGIPAAENGDDVREFAVLLATADARTWPDAGPAWSGLLLEVRIPNRRPPKGFLLNRSRTTSGGLERHKALDEDVSCHFKDAPGRVTEHFQPQA
jgi:hypothetical protein